MSVEFEEDPFEEADNIGAHLEHIWERLSLRAVFVMSLGVFLTTLALGAAFQDQASASDLQAPTLQASVAARSQSASLPESIVFSMADVSDPSPQSLEADETYLEFDPETAERLSHSDLTSATLTRSRLTSAHFFTETTPTAKTP